MFSSYLKSRHNLCKSLVNRLLKKYKYVSILGKEVKGSAVRVSTRSTNIGDTMERQCGFVCKIYNNTSYSEYSFSDINENNIDDIEKEIIEKTKLTDGLKADQVIANLPDDEELVKDFYRPLDGPNYSTQEIIKELTNFKSKVHALSDKIVNAIFGYEAYEVSSMFISKNKDLTQNYQWNLVLARLVARDNENIKDLYNVCPNNSIEKSLKQMEEKLPDMVETLIALLDSKMIEPGMYDIITTPSITGLIAHEAFGHGVELDMFVKNRAKAKNYINEYVASPLINMHDGASAVISQASYFFDDDGILASDTLIIKDGILQRGISDMTSAMELGLKPTGNGRRENMFHKAYSRMTNTFFEPGNDNLDDMIKSIKKGYMLFQMDNGMEDPKNWNIQCTAAYGKEIIDGKFTGKIVAPVVMSGYVLDLLKSITMVSKEFEVIGSGHCGKGHKEWVPVSDGGPYLKARCKLG